ncbi:MAG: hypothetical protein AB7E55_08680 [Pigmentiphaga sp.]
MSYVLAVAAKGRNPIASNMPTMQEATREPFTSRSRFGIKSEVITEAIRFSGARME